MNDGLIGTVSGMASEIHAGVFIALLAILWPLRDSRRPVL